MIKIGVLALVAYSGVLAGPTPVMVQAHRGLTGVEIDGMRLANLGGEASDRNEVRGNVDGAALGTYEDLIGDPTAAC